MTNKKTTKLISLGTRFGMLKVISFAHSTIVKSKTRNRVERHYNVQCDCGNIALKLGRALSSGQTTSCGCKRAKHARSVSLSFKGKKRPELQKVNGGALLHSQYLSYKNSASKRKIEFSITKKEFADLTSRNCSYCGAKPKLLTSFHGREDGRTSPLLFTGIDRFNNLIGYVIGNCAPCCSTCNYMKRQMSFPDFIEHMRKIFLHMGSK